MTFLTKKSIVLPLPFNQRQQRLHFVLYAGVSYLAFHRFKAFAAKAAGVSIADVILFRFRKIQAIALA
jgi:hypothetical protein